MALVKSGVFVIFGAYRIITDSRIDFESIFTLHLLSGTLFRSQYIGDPERLSAFFAVSERKAPAVEYQITFRRYTENKVFRQPGGGERGTFSDGLPDKGLLKKRVARKKMIDSFRKDIYFFPEGISIKR